MVDSTDWNKLYTEWDENIKKGDHTQCLHLSNKILSSSPSEDKAIKCKIISWINLNQNDTIISFLKDHNLQTEYLIEYAYALYESKRHQESIDVLSKAPATEQTQTLLAQNFFKMNNFIKSYEIYKSIIISKKEEIENDTDLLANFLAAYALSNINDEEFLNSLRKYFSTWECYFNYIIINLNRKDYNTCMEIIKRTREEYAKELEEDMFNKIKQKHLNLYMVQSTFDGFELNKQTTINSEFDKFFADDNKFPEMMPFFYNNHLNIKKDKETTNEIIKKLDAFLGNPALTSQEKKVLMKNKLNILIRGNKLKEAGEILNSLLMNPDTNSDPNWIIAKSYLYYKSEKDNYEQWMQNDTLLKTAPEAQLLVIQWMLSSLTVKSIEQFHLKVLSFIATFKGFCMNYHFISFFIGFYNSRKLKEYLKEFIKHFKDINEIVKCIPNKSNLKNIIIKIANGLSLTEQYQDSANFYTYYLRNINADDNEVKMLWMQSLTHFDWNRSEEIRRSIDETAVDLSNENLDRWLNELFTKFRKPNQQGKDKKIKKKKKKIRYPKGFDPKTPSPIQPDPERWLPRLQRKKYRSLAKNKLAYQGATADNQATTGKFK